MGVARERRAVRLLEEGTEELVPELHVERAAARQNGDVGPGSNVAAIEGEVGVGHHRGLDQALVARKDAECDGPTIVDVEPRDGVTGEIPLVAELLLAEELAIRGGDCSREADRRRSRRRVLGAHSVERQRRSDAENGAVGRRILRRAVDEARVGLVRAQEPVRVVADLAADSRVELEVPAAEPLAFEVTPIPQPSLRGRLLRHQEERSPDREREDRAADHATDGTAKEGANSGSAIRHGSRSGGRGVLQVRVLRGCEETNFLHGDQDRDRADYSRAGDVIRRRNYSGPSSAATLETNVVDFVLKEYSWCRAAGPRRATGRSAGRAFHRAESRDQSSRWSACLPRMRLPRRCTGWPLQRAARSADAGP